MSVLFINSIMFRIPIKSKAQNNVSLFAVKDQLDWSLFAVKNQLDWSLFAVKYQLDWREGFNPKLLTACSSWSETARLTATYASTPAMPTDAANVMLQLLATVWKLLVGGRKVLKHENN